MKIRCLMFMSSKSWHVYMFQIVAVFSHRVWVVCKGRLWEWNWHVPNLQGQIYYRYNNFIIHLSISIIYLDLPVSIRQQSFPSLINKQPSLENGPSMESEDIINPHSPLENGVSSLKINYYIMKMVQIFSLLESEQEEKLKCMGCTRSAHFR